MALGIDLRVSGFREAGAAVQGLADGTKRLAETTTQASARIKAASADASRSWVALGRSQQDSVSAQSRSARGWQSLARRQAQDRAQVKREEREQERQEAKQQRDTPAARLASLVGTTRIGGSIGGMGAFPLVNRLGAAAGLGAAETTSLALGATAAGAALAVTVAGLKAFSEQVLQTGQSLRELRTAGLQTGGTAGQTAGLAAVGIAPGDQTGMAAALRERLSVTGGNPFALAAGRRANISPQLPAEFGGDQNNAQILEQALQRLHELRGSELQLVEARRFGLTAALDQVNVSDRVWEAELRLGRARAASIDPRTAQDAADLNAEMRTFQGNVTLLRDRLMGVQVTGVSRTLGLLNEWMEKLTGQGKGDMAKTNPQTAALQKNTEAIQAHTAVIKQGQFLRGGTRADAAVPAKMRDMALQRAIESGAISKGRVAF